MTIKTTEARTLVAKIKKSSNDIEMYLRRFHEVRGWAVLGYDSFLSWWDADMADVAIAPALRNWAIFEMVEGARTGKKVPAGTYAQVADLMGVTNASVKSVLSRARYKIRETSRNDDDLTTLSFMAPERWRRNILMLASTKNVNMADILRVSLARGIKSVYGVDVDATTATPKPSAGRSRSAA